MPDRVMIFAAGFGTRMGALTKTQPKPMVKVNGRPLLDHALDLVPNDCRSVVNTHYLHDQIADHLQGRPKVDVLYEPTILETGGGLKNALPQLGNQPIFTMNSDAIWTGANPLNALNQAWDPLTMDALLMLIPRENAQEHTGVGDFHLDEKRRIDRRGQAASAVYVYSGIQIIKTDQLLDIKEDIFSLNRLWDLMLTEKRVFGLVHEGGWVDVGRPEGIAVAEKCITMASDV